MVVVPHSHSDLNGLFPLLQRLDRLLEFACAKAEIASTPSDTAGSIPKQHLDFPEVEPATVIPQGSPIDWLRQTFELSAFDLDVLIIALAPELDQRYEQLYCYLQKDGRCCRPTVGLALDLLCTSAREKFTHRVHFSTNALLIRHQLLHLTVRPDQHQPTLLRQELHLDPQVIHLLLGQTGLDQRLTHYCQLIEPLAVLNPPLLLPQTWQSLVELTSHHWQRDRPLRLYFEGPDAVIKQHTAEALARTLQVPLLKVDLNAIAASKTDLRATLFLTYREAQFQTAWLYFHSLESLLKEETTAAYQFLLTAMADYPGIVILAGSQPWNPTNSQPLGVVPVTFPLPDFEQRRTCWQTHLAAAEIILDAPDLDALSDRFRLTSYQIADAVTTACNTVQWQTLGTSTPRATPLLADLFAAARAQSGHDLASLAHKIEPRYRWEDLVLPEETWIQLQEIAVQAKNRSVVYRDWGFDQKLSLGKGLNTLFSGPPGTGKTMAAEVIANTLQLDLYKIDLSQVVSKYIGETEKSLNRIFTAAANSNAILLFDEADALFGKRSEVRDAHDRYANIETSYLLQKMEEYDGIAILTTNLRSNMDEAFTRRLRFIIDFPFPGVIERRQIWRQVWPSKMPLDSDLNWDFLAQRFEITGANIRNIALMAAFFAAEDSHIVQMAHLIRAVRREYQKMGKILMTEEWEA